MLAPPNVKLEHAIKAKGGGGPRRWVRLALMLLHEWSLGGASRVSGYVGQLPSDFGTPLHWTPSQLSALGYPHLQAEVRPAIVLDHG